MVTFVGSPAHKISHAYSQGEEEEGPTAERGNILLDPVHSQALISETEVRVAAAQYLVRHEEAPSAQPIVDRDANDGLADGNGVLHHERQIVALVNAAAFEVTPAVDPRQD